MKVIETVFLRGDDPWSILRGYLLACAACGFCIEDQKGNRCETLRIVTDTRQRSSNILNMR